MSQKLGLADRQRGISVNRNLNNLIQQNCAPDQQHGFKNPTINLLKARALANHDNQYKTTLVKKERLSTLVSNHPTTTKLNNVNHDENAPIAAHGIDLPQLDPLTGKLLKLKLENADNNVAAAAATTVNLPQISLGEIFKKRASSRIPRLSIRPQPPIECEAKTPVDEQPMDITFIDDDDGLPEGVEDIDNPTSRDAIFQVTEFVKDIYEYLRHLEKVQCIQPNFLKNQKIYTSRIRTRLVNWCIQIHEQLKLLPETLYLAIAIMDRYFQAVDNVQQNQVQLIGAVALFVASKYEEIYPPDISDLVHLCTGNYHRRDIIKMEINILKTLQFDLGRPLPLSFLRRFSRVAHCDLKMHTLAKYLMELSLCEYECAHWKPSLLAASALYVTIVLMGDGQWTKSLIYYTGYDENQLKANASILCKLIKKSSKSPQLYNAVKKYSSSVALWSPLRSPNVDKLATHNMSCKLPTINAAM